MGGTPGAWIHRPSGVREPWYSQARRKVQRRRARRVLEDERPNALARLTATAHLYGWFPSLARD
jgi:hypothetical protein